MHWGIKMKHIALTNIRINWAQPMRHLETEATSTQGKFLTLAPNKTEKIVTFIHP